MRGTRRGPTLGVMAGALMLLVTACGGVDDPAASPADASEPAPSASSVGTSSPTPTESRPGGDPPASATPSRPVDKSSSSGLSPAEPLVLSAPPQTLGRCLPPSVSPLRSLAAYAFAGTVTGVSNQRVAIEVSRWYAGDSQPATVTVTAAPVALRNLVQAAEFRVGENYLVAANADQQVLVCGFTTREIPRSKRLYERAFSK